MVIYNNQQHFGFPSHSITAIFAAVFIVACIIIFLEKKANRRKKKKSKSKVEVLSSYRISDCKESGLNYTTYF